MVKPALAIVAGEFTIHRFDLTAEIPPNLAGQPFCWIARTDAELSIVCRSTLEIDSAKQSTGWSCLKVQGPLDLELTGILAGIAEVLARARISTFALSTFDTDYLLVKSEQRELAATALKDAGYIFS